MEYSEEQLNYFRLSLIVRNEFPRALRAVFKQQWDILYGATLGEWKDELRNGLDFLNKESARNQRRNAHLLTTMRGGNRAEWDCSMLFYAILFSDCIHSLSPEVRSNVDALRKFRNDYFAHLSEGIISVLQFQNIIEKVQTAFQALGISATKIQEIKNKTSFPTEELRDTLMKVDDLKLEVKNQTSFGTEELRDTVKKPDDLKQNVEKKEMVLQEKEGERQALGDQLKNGISPFCVLPPKPSHDVASRYREVAEIIQQLKELKKENNDKLSCIYISGKTGSGKSQLASLVAKRFFNDPPSSVSFVMTINAERADTVLESYVAFSRQLKFPENAVTTILHSDFTIDEKITHLKSLIGTKIELYTSWLLVVDNVTSISQVQVHLPAAENEIWAGGQLLITTQDSASIPPASSLNKHISISKGMHPDDVSYLLEKLAGITDKEMEIKVAKALDYHPLALASAAFYVRHVRQNEVSSDFCWRDFLKNLEENQESPSEIKPSRTDSQTTAVMLSTDMVMKSDKVIHDAFDFLSLCAPQPVRSGLVINYIILNGQTRDEEMISPILLRCPLLITEVRESGLYIGVHHVVHEVLQVLAVNSIATAKYLCIFERTVTSFSQFLENGSAYRYLDESFPHLETVIKKAETSSWFSLVRQSKLSGVFDLVADFGYISLSLDKLLLAKKYYQLSMTVSCGKNGIMVARAKSLIAHVNVKLGELNEARSCYESALEILLDELGPHHAEVATAYSCLGSVYHKLCDFEPAREHYVRSLDILLKEFGAKHVDVVRSYNNLGAVYCDLNDLEKAKNCLDEALAIGMGELGPEHVHVATTYNNLGLVNCAMGDFEKAKEYHNLALDVRLKKLGPEHIGVAGCYNDLGVVYCALGDVRQGQKYFGCALSIYHKKLGREHVHIATVYKNLGSIYKRIGDLQKAKTHYECAHDCFLKLWGPNHANVAISWNALAGVSCEMGDFQKAKSFYEHSLAIQEEIDVAKDTNVVRTFNGLGFVHSELGEFQEALKYYEQSLAISLELLGTGHADVATIHNSLGLILQNLGDLKRAKEHFERALDINRETLDEEHPSMASLYNNVGILCRTSRKFEESKEFHYRALEIRCKGLGGDSVYVAMTYNDLGLTLCELDDLEKAKECFEKALSIFKEKLGPDHLYAAHACRNLGFLHSKRREWNKANENYDRAVRCYRKTLGPEHDSVASCYIELSLVNQALKRFTQAKKYCEQALAIWQK